MDIRIDGTANFSQVRTQFAELQAQVKALNAELRQTGIASAGAVVNPNGYRNMQSAMRASSSVFRDAAASSGRFYTQQIRLNTATEQYTKLLQKQKVSFRDMVKNREMLRKAYREQIALQNMYIRESPSMSAGGKRAYDIAVPRQVSKELDSINNRLGFTKTLIASASTQMVNWGKNTQWAGRQIMVGFTIPIAAFGAATGVLAYNVDKNLTRVLKVYDTTAVGIKGDVDSMNAVHKELQEVSAAAWNTAAVAAKNYGAAAADTMGVQASLAATGVKGSALQEDTTQVMRIAALGELEYQQAVDATIALQSAFRLSTTQLAEAFNFMNATENATSLSIQDIIEATPRAASAMSALGVSVEQMTTMLVSMRESGVDAAEAANALKSATGTILAPSPAADEFIKQISNGQVEVTKLAEASGGNLYLAMKVLFDQMNGLNKLQKQQILVKLFGKYQFNRISAMLYNMGDAFNGVQNQTSKAMDLMGQDSAKLADIADAELQRWQESVSGRWKIALESLKVQLAEMGKPFLEIGIYVLDALSGFADFFNSLPGGVKKVAMVSAILTALAGPMIMLAGLTMNLLGNMLKMGSSLVFLGNQFELVTKESKAMELASKVAAAGFVTESTAIQELIADLRVLTAAQIEARQAAVGGPVHVAPVSVATLSAQATSTTPGAVYGTTGHPLGSQGSDFTKNNMQGYIPIPAPVNPYTAAMDSMEEIDDLQNKVTDGAEEEGNQRKKTSGYAKGAAASMGLMAVSMGLMMVSGNEFVDDLLMLTMIGSIVVPAAQVLIPLLAQGASNAKVLVTNLMAASVEARGLAAGSAASATGFRATAAAVMGMIGPIGWAALAITAIVGGVYMWEKHQQKVWDSAVKANEALQGTSEQWAQSMGHVVGEYEKINLISADINKRQVPQFEADVASYKTGEQKDVGAAFDDLSEMEKSRQAMQMFIDLQVVAGMTAGEAASKIKALYVATGSSLAYATEQATNLNKGLGDLKESSDWILAIDNQSYMFTDNLEAFVSNNENDQIVKSAAENLANVFSQGFANANAADAKTMFGQVEETALLEWERVLLKLKDAPGGADFLEAKGITTAKGLSQAFRAMESPIDEMRQYMDDSTAATIENASMSANAAEKIVIGAIADVMHLGENITTVWELQTEYNVAAQMLSYDGAVKSAKMLYAQTAATAGLQRAMANAPLIGSMFSDNGADEAENLAKMQINAYNVAHGFKEGATYAEALENLLGRVKNETAGAASEARSLGGALRSAFNFSGEDYTSILKTSMGSLQDQMATTAEANFDSTMQSALDSRQDYWDNRVDAQDRAQENAMDAFDKRWELRKTRVENYYDTRIEKIEDTIEAEQKAEEKRQKIFEAEMTRLDRMNEVANRNIDFNVALNAGNLDEAAKIRNDAAAQFNEWMLQDAGKQSSTKSERRQERLKDRADKLGDRKDKALEALQKREDAEREHLQRLQEMRADALKEQADADMDARKAAWEADKASYDARLELFKSWTGRSIEDLERWMKVVGFSYEDFGDKRLKPMGQDWATYFREQLKTNVRNAGIDIANDNMWSKMAKKEAEEVLLSFGFENLAQLREFIRTGEMPEVKRSSTTEPGAHIHHAGGVIGESPSSRRGVARNAGLHSSEEWVLGQRGERIFDRRTSQENRGLFDFVAKGGDPAAWAAYSEKRPSGGGIPSNVGVASAAMNALMNAGMKTAIGNAVRKRRTPSPLAISTKGILGLLASGPPTAGANYGAGSGGWHSPLPPGYHFTSQHDIPAPMGTPVYAVNDGVITESRAITSGGSPEAPEAYPKGYTSYGVTEVLQTAGAGVRYAHMLPGSTVGLGPVKGGQQIGRTAATGNAHGFHLHMDINGAEIADSWLTAHGISLDKGAMNINKDGVRTTLHKNEGVLTEDYNTTFKKGMEMFANLKPMSWSGMGGLRRRSNMSVNRNVANGGTNIYNLTVNANGTSASARDIARLAIAELKAMEDRLPSSRRANVLEN